MSKRNDVEFEGLLFKTWSSQWGQKLFHKVIYFIDLLSVLIFCVNQISENNAACGKLLLHSALLSTKEVYCFLYPTRRRLKMYFCLFLLYLFIMFSNCLLPEREVFASLPIMPSYGTWKVLGDEWRASEVYAAFSAKSVWQARGLEWSPKTSGEGIFTTLWIGQMLLRDRKPEVWMEMISLKLFRKVQLNLHFLQTPGFFGVKKKPHSLSSRQEQLGWSVKNTKQMAV